MNAPPLLLSIYYQLSNNKNCLVWAHGTIAPYQRNNSWMRCLSCAVKISQNTKTGDFLYVTLKLQSSLL